MSRKCTECDGRGWRFILPRGNPFAMRIEVLAQALEKRRCHHCHGTGDRSYNMQTTDDH
jgi:hypothetical protein